MSNINSQFGAKTETTAGTEVVVNRFWPVMETGEVSPDRHTADENGLRATGWVELQTGTRVAKAGGTIKPKFEWMTAGMGWWLLHMLGTTATTGPTDSAYVHTGTVGSLYGDSFTCQVNTPLYPAGTNQSMTMIGCKIPKWDLELKAGEGNKLEFSPEIDYRSMDDDTALASASYATAAPYTWFDVSTLTLGGTAITLDSLKISVDNNLKTKNYKLQSSGNVANEQTHAGRRKVEVEIEADFADLATWWNRYRATAAASTAAQLILTLTAADTGLTIGTSTQPTMTITIPKLRVEKIAGLMAKSPGEGVTQKVSCAARWDGSNSPITIACTSSDSTA